MSTRIHIPMAFRDSENLYLEFPAIPNGPTGFVLRFPFTEGGMAKALKHVPDITPPGGHNANASRVLAVKMEQQVKVARKSHTRPTKYTKQESQEFLDRFLPAIKGTSK